MHKPLTLINFQPVDGGAIVDATYLDAIWYFKFANSLEIRCFSGWLLYEQGQRNKSLLGSRDVEGVRNPGVQLLQELEGFRLTNFVFFSQKASLELAFHNDKLDQRGIQIHKTSVANENWQIIGEDFVDNDKKNIIEKLK